MNSALISPGISAIFSALLSDYSPETMGGGPSAEVSGIDFGELLNNQQDVGELMQHLEKLLPPKNFERLKLAIEDGKSLPQAVTIAVGKLPNDGYWEPESSAAAAFTVQQQPFNTGQLQPPSNNPFAGSPDTLPIDAGPGPFLQLSTAPVPADGTAMVSPLTALEDPEQAIHRQSTAVPQPVIKLPSSTAVVSSDPRQAGMPGKTFSPATTLTGSTGLLQSTASSVARQPTVSGVDNGLVAPTSPGDAPSAMTGHLIPNIRIPVSGTVQQPLTGEQAVSTQSAAIYSAVSGIMPQASLPTDSPSAIQSTTVQPNSATHSKGITADLNHLLPQTRMSGPDGVRVVTPSSPDLVSRTVIPEPVTNGRIPTGENLYQPSRAEAASSALQATAAVPANPVSTLAPAVAVTGIARFIQPLSTPDQSRAQSMPASADGPAQTMSGEGGNPARTPVAENLFRPDRAGSVAPSQPMLAAGTLARMLTQPTVSVRPPVSMPKVAAGTTPSPEVTNLPVIDAGRTTPTIPLTDNLIQPIKQDLAAMQQFTTVISTAGVASDQGAQTSAAAPITGGMGGGAVSQTGNSLPQPSGPINLNLEAPLGTKDWGEAVGERILWMVGRTIQGATLRVTPPHLGSIDIQLTLQQDQTKVSFTTQNGAVREALEAAIPRLREMFVETNLQLANVDVNHRQAEDQRGMSGNAGRDKGNGSEMGEDGRRGKAETGNEPTTLNHLADSNSDRLLDYYA